MSDVEQRLAKAEAKIEDIENARLTERREMIDAMEKVFSKLNDLRETIALQSHYSLDVTDLKKRIAELEASGQKLSGVWWAMGIVGTVMLAAGAGIAWLFDHLSNLKNALK